MRRQETPASGYAVREIEWLMATYHVSLREAVWSFPRLVVLLLMPAYAERQGNRSGYTYTDRASLRARAELRKQLRASYNVVDKPVSETGWQIGDPPDFIARRYLTPPAPPNGPRA